MDEPFDYPDWMNPYVVVLQVLLAGFVAGLMMVVYWQVKKAEREEKIRSLARQEILKREREKQKD